MVFMTERPSNPRQTRLLTTLLQAESVFTQEFAKVTDDQKAVKALQHVAVREIAIFFFLLKQNRVTDGRRIREAAIAHNALIDELKDDQSALGAIKKTQAQISSAKFTEHGIAKLMSNYELAGNPIDQSDLSRFLALQMSTETCRSTIELLSRYDFLERSKIETGSTLIRNTTKLIEIVSNYLANLDEELRKFYQEQEIAFQ